MKTRLQPHAFPSGRREKPGRAAFTLLEIMLVVLIMGLIMAMGIPTIKSGFNKQGMAQAEGLIEDACTAARRTAILTGKQAELHISAPDKKVDAPGVSGQLSDQIDLDLLDVNSVDYMKADSATVRFFPNGRCDDLTVGLVDPKHGRVREISLDILTSTFTAEDLHR